MKAKTTRRQPKTERGSNVIGRVVATAKSLLAERWLDEISISELARAAGVARASLLLQFSKGWPDVAWEVFASEFNQQIEDVAVNLVSDPGSRSANERLYELLDQILMRANETGLLYRNLRSQMFVWGDDYDFQAEIQLSDLHETMPEILAQASPQVDTMSVEIMARRLFEETLDLAASSEAIWGDLEARRKILRVMIDVVVRGVQLQPQ